MKKITSLLLTSLLLLSVQATFAATASQDKSASFDAAVKEYDFENNSYNISDEQLHIESGEESLQKDRKASFWSKIVNSSHFSSNTATKTWTPFNKAE